ncbi:MAG: RnfABCDGE type electron transport complex subunit G [Sedimentibacter sp.]
MKNSYVRLGGILFIIAAISAGILAFLNDTTKDLIAQNEAMASMDPAVLEAVMPGAVMFNDLEDTALIDTIKAENEKFVNLQVAVDASNNELGYVVRTFSTVAGYGGDMELFVGISPEGKITGVNVVSHSETSGLGSRTTEPEFTSQFAGKDASTEIVEFDALTGATKSSKSFLSAVNNAINIYSQYLK